jgi:hypothetical protein
MEQITRYRNAAEHLSNELDSMVEDIDPIIYEAALGRYLIVKTLIDKAADILLQDSNYSAAYSLISRAVADRFSIESGFKKSG